MFCIPVFDFWFCWRVVMEFDSSFVVLSEVVHMFGSAIENFEGFDWCINDGG